MIRLRSETVVVALPDGTARPVDLEQWRVELADCCRQAGVNDAAVAADVVRIVQHFVKQQTGVDRPCPAARLGTLLCRVLVDAGLHEVAARFGRRYDFLVVPQPESLSAEPETVQGVLASDPRFLGRSLPPLAAETVAMARQLEVSEAPASFYCELALAACRRHRHRGKTGGQPGYWLLSQTEVGEVLGAELRDAGKRGVLVWRPVSRLLPTLDLGLHLPGLAPAGPVPYELDLYPRFDALCAAVGKAFERLRCEAERRLGDGGAAAVRGGLRCRGGDGLIRQALGLGGRSAVSVRQELRSVAEFRLAGLPWVRIYWPP